MDFIYTDFVWSHNVYVSTYYDFAIIGYVNYTVVNFRKEIYSVYGYATVHANFHINVYIFNNCYIDSNDNLLVETMDCYLSFPAFNQVSFNVWVYFNIGTHDIFDKLLYLDRNTY